MSKIIFLKYVVSCLFVKLMHIAKICLLVDIKKTSMSKLLDSAVNINLI